MTTGRGVTLVELTLSLVLFGVIGTVLVRATLELGRSVTALQRRTDAALALEQANAFLAAELQELWRGDLRRVAGDSLSYRGVRVAGLACAVSATEVRLIVQRQPGGRDAQAGRDTLLLFRGPNLPWAAVPILAIAPGSCDSVPALRITTLVDSTTLAGVALLALVPARIVEAMQARLYRSSGEWWLGARSESAGEGVQPLAGPFLPGAPWHYFDSAGSETASPHRVRTIQVKLAAGADTTTMLIAPPGLR